VQAKKYKCHNQPENQKIVIASIHRARASHETARTAATIKIKREARA
jgi:hypothetical protein